MLDNRSWSKWQQHHWKRTAVGQSKIHQSIIKISDQQRHAMLYVWHNSNCHADQCTLQNCLDHMQLLCTPCSIKQNQTAQNTEHYKLLRCANNDVHKQLLHIFHSNRQYQQALTAHSSVTWCLSATYYLDCLTTEAAECKSVSTCWNASVVVD